MNEQALRALLQKVLDWDDAHVGFDSAVAGSFACAAAGKRQ